MSTKPPRPLRQACAIPYRVRRGKLEFCLITTTRRGRWAFPKGIVDPGETPAQTALKEAHEEAGLRGTIEGKRLGEYTYSKWRKQLVVRVFLMRVTRTERSWLEANLRQRCWCPVDEARQRIGRKKQRRLLEAALTKLQPPSEDGEAATS